jgi:hypothetical protein
MRQLLESISRISEAQASLGERCFESHIIFDGGVKQKELTEYALILISLLNDTLGKKTLIVCSFLRVSGFSPPLYKCLLFSEYSCFLHPSLLNLMTLNVFKPHTFVIVKILTDILSAIQERNSMFLYAPVCYIVYLLMLHVYIVLLFIVLPWR